MDAVSYLSSALEAYRALDLHGQKQLLAEAAAVGQKGLAINDPKQMHQLRLYQGEPRSQPCRSLASITWESSCCYRGRTRGSTSRGSMSWRRGWRGLSAEPVACRFCIAIGSFWCHPRDGSPPQPPSWFWLWSVPLGVLLARRVVTPLLHERSPGVAFSWPCPLSRGLLDPGLTRWGWISIRHHGT